MNEIQEKINEDNSRINKGLSALSDWLEDKGYEELGSNDYNYYQGIIKEVRERLKG